MFCRSLIFVRHITYPAVSYTHLMTDYINELVPYMDGKQDVDTFLGKVQKDIDEVYGK